MTVSSNWLDASAGVATIILFVVVIFNISELLFSVGFAGHDLLVGLNVLDVVAVKFDDGLGSVVGHSDVASLFNSCGSVVSVAAEVHIWSILVISEEHVLGVIVDQVVLFSGEVELSDEASDSEFLDNLADVELAVEACAGLALQLVLIRVRVLAAEAPWAREVLLLEEAPHGVPERSAPVTHFMQ